MIQEVKMFTIICDNCKKDVAEDEEFSCWGDQHQAEDNAMESNWTKEEGKHYCNDCYYYDDDNMLLISEARYKQKINFNTTIKTEL